VSFRVKQRESRKSSPPEATPLVRAGVTVIERSARYQSQGVRASFTLRH
jgi:hypothetical protein